MADKIIRKSPTGNMDKDSDLRYVGKGQGREGDFIDARNIQIAQDSGQSGGDAVPTLGTKFGFDLGSVDAQDKIYRVTVDGDAAKSHSLSFLSTNRDGRIGTGTGPNGEVEFNGTVASLVAAVQAAGLSAVMSILQSGNEVTFRMTAYPYYQWYLESVGTDDVSVICTQEAIPVDLAGPLKDIGSYDLLGDLFVFSTTQDNEPTELDLEVTAIGPITAGVYTGPLTFLTFSQPHGLVIGQWIRITNSQAPWLNGLFVVRQINSATEIGIPTVLAWGGTRPQITSFTETIRINPSGIGEIGVAQKDDNSDSWTYIRLLRSVELNFVSRWKVGIVGDKNFERVSLYFDDDYTPSGVFYYYGKYLVGGALSNNNSSNFYSFGNISSLISAAKKKPPVRIDFSSQEQSGGNVPSGNIRYFVLMKDFFNNWTYPSDLSNIVITYSDESSGLSIGDASSVTNTNKSNVISISGINTQIYNELRLGYAIEIEGVVSASILMESQVDGSETIVKHDGFCQEESYDIGLLASNFFSSYDFAKSNKIIDNRLIRSNLRKKEIKDFSKWAKTFKHRIKEEFLQGSSDSSGDQEFQNPENGFYKIGYMFNEAYRFSVRGRFRDTGELTPWFWVDDIKIDPFLTNQYNPNDNRREQTGSDIVTNFDLTKNIGGPYPTNRWVKIPYVEFFNVDLNFLIDGNPVSSVLESIEFGRAEVIPEVLCTGIVTMSSYWNRTSGSIEYLVNNTTGSVAQPFIGTSGDYADACFPFTFELQAGKAYTKFLIQTEGDEDSAKVIREHLFVYGPPYMGSTSFAPNSVYPELPADNAGYNYNYPQASGVNYGDEIRPIKQSGVDISPFVSERRVVSLYSPDIIFKKVSDISGYSILDMGEMFAPTSIIDEPFFNRISKNKGSMYSQYVKYFPENLGTSFNLYDVGEVKSIPRGGQDFIGPNGYEYKKHFGIANRSSIKNFFTMVDKSHVNIDSPVIYVENNGRGLEYQGKNVSNGVHYVQMYKEAKNKYCSKKSEQYYTTGAIFSLNGISALNGVIDKGILSVFGGDTLTQLTYLKGRSINKEGANYRDLESNETGTIENWTTGQFSTGGVPGFGGGMKFYSQNRVNSQMRNDDEEQIVFLSDGSDPIYPWLEEQGNRVDLNSYSSKYTPSIPASIFQPSFEYLSDEPSYFPQRIEYSSKKTYSAKEDDYLDRPILNIYDLNLTFGEIIHHEDVGGELFTIQNRKYSILPFNARGQLESTSNSVDVLLKSGDVFTTDGKTLSSYGTQHKWSCLKGYNANGKDVLYWFNAENGLMMRFGEDGTRVISDRGMKAFFANYTKWVKGKHEPAFEQGIRGVWDDRRKEAIWTFIGWREVPQWTNSGIILVQSLVGTVVMNSNAPSDTYEAFPRFFRCKVAHTASSAREPGLGVDWEDFWEQIPYTDYNYYSIFTVCFNEETNGFRCFYGHIPKTYFRWQNTFLSSHPIYRNLIFEHRLGEPTTWYGVDGLLIGNIAPKVEDASIEMIANELPEQTMQGVAVRFLCKNAPDRVDYRTERHHTWGLEPQFVKRNDQWEATIRNDVTVTGDPTGRGDRISGDYIRFKFTIFGGVYNLFHSIVLKYRDRSRKLNS